MCWIYRLELLGVAISNLVMAAIQLAIIIWYVQTRPDVYPYFGPIVLKDAISAKEFMKLAVPSAIMQYFDSWIFSVSILIASYFSVVDNASQTILKSIAAFFFLIGASFSGATTALVGAAVGKGKIERARNYVA